MTELATVLAKVLVVLRQQGAQRESVVQLLYLGVER